MQGKRQLLSLAVMAAAAVVLAVCNRPGSRITPLAKPANLPPAVQRRLAANVARYLDSISVSHFSMREEAKAAATLALLRYTNRIPIYSLQSLQPELERRIQRDGRDTYLSFLVDYGYRLLMFGSDDTRRGFQRLQVFLARSPTAKRGLDRGRAYVRAADGRGFWSVQGEVVVLISRLVFSEYGRRKIGAGYQPQDFLQILGFYSSCKQQDQEAKRRGSEAHRRQLVRAAKREPDICAALVSEIENGQAGNGDAGVGFPADVQALVGRGIMGATRECISNSSDAAAQQIREQLEQARTCHKGSDGGVHPAAQGIASSYDNCLHKQVV